MFNYKFLFKIVMGTLTILLLPLLILAAVLAVAQPAIDKTESIVAFGDMLSSWSDLLLVVRVCLLVSLIIWWNEIVHWYLNKKGWSEEIEKSLLESRWFFAFSVFFIECSKAIGSLLW